MARVVLHVLMLAAAALAAGALDGCAAAPEAPPAPESSACALAVNVLRGESPKVDGRLDDAFWRKAASAGDFKLASGGEPSVKTRLLVARDDSKLYIAVECFEPADRLRALKADSTARDGNVWEDDDVELFIDPTGKRRSYCQIIINSKGVIYDSRYKAVREGDDSWNPDFESAAAVGDASWTAEFALPFAAFGKKEEAAPEWAFNVFRSRKTAPEENIFWSPVGAAGDAHAPQRFGVLIGMPGAKPAAEAPAPAASPGSAGELVLADFEGALDGFELSEGMTTAFTAEGATRGKQALEVTFPPGPYPGMGKPLHGELRDWSGFDCLALSVLNPSKAEVRLSVRIDDPASKDFGSRFNLDGTVKLPPGARTVEIPILQMERGGIFCAGIDARNVALLKLFVGDVKEPVKLVFDEMKLVRHPRPKEAWKDVLVTGDGRNWEASGVKAEEAAKGVVFSNAGGNYPGISINDLGSLYGWTLMELAYRTDAGVRSMSIKLVAAGGEKITMITGVGGEGTVIIPLLVAADIPLGDVRLMQIFFGGGDCPSKFELSSVRLYRMPDGSSDAARPEATKLVADFTPCGDLARNSMFNAWLWLPQAGGGGRRVKKTVARNETLTRVFDAKDLAGGCAADETPPTKALPPEEMLKTRTPILTGYFIEHGGWHFCTKRLAVKDGETATARFELKEVGR